MLQQLLIVDEMIEISQPVDTVTVNCLCKAMFCYWHNKQRSELRLDRGLPVWAQRLGHGHMHAVLMWDSLLDSHGRAAPKTDCSSFSLGSWRTLFVWFKRSECVCTDTHTHSHTGDRGWLTPFSFPSVLILTCIFFKLKVFHFLLLSVKLLRGNWDLHTQ